MTLKLQLRITQITALVVGIVLVLFLTLMTYRLIKLEQTHVEDYTRIQHEISNINKKSHYAGG